MDELFPSLIGQERAKKAITDWYKYDTCPLLIFGPSGYGKTAFAESLDAKIIDTTQLRSDRVSSLLKPIKEADDGDILFFDEIHTLQPKVLEGLYYIFDKGTFFDPEIGIDLPIPHNMKFIFATNYLNKLPIAFQTRVKLVELQNYTEDELKEIIIKKYPTLNKDGLNTIIKACKGTPRTALRLAGDVVSGLKTEKIEKANTEDMNNILNSRFGIDPTTGLSESEFTIIQKVCERGHLSTTAIANTLKLSIQDTKDRYINPLQISDWLCVTSKGVVPGFKAYEHYRLFVKKIRG